jgi:prolyl 4-hydroxylase
VEEKKLKLVHESPNIYVMDAFLTASELQYCTTLFEDARFCKSFVDTSDSQKILVEDQRTSSFLSFQKLQNSFVTSMEKRASDLLGLSVEQIEPLQLVRYRVGEFFGVHHDLGILYDDGSVELPPKNHWSKRRMVTIFVYLNASDGCTSFPALDLKVTPKCGRAVLFCNILQNGMPDPRTVHAGEPPQSGVKYGLNIWACET